MLLFRFIRSKRPTAVVFQSWRLAFLLAGLNSLILSAAGQSVYSEVYTFSTFAGVPETGSADGVGTDAQFNTPSSVALDGAGNVYVADTGNSTLRKITPAGVVTTLAGLAGSPGASDGTGRAARFRAPYGVAVDSTGNVYVADTYNNTIRKVTPAGVVTTLAGYPGGIGNADGTGSAALFNAPYGLAVDSGGNVYVADTENDTIRMVTPAGVVTTLAGLANNPGANDGTGSAARFDGPYSIAVDSATNLYVTDTYNDTIRVITPGGVVTTLAGEAGNPGHLDGTGTGAQFFEPNGVAVDSEGNVYVADTFNETIRVVAPGGVVSTVAGAVGSVGYLDATGIMALFNYPAGVAVDSEDTLYVADAYNAAIRQITPAGLVTTMAGVADSAGSANGTGAEARFDAPQGVAATAGGAVYVADTDNGTIRQITSAGVASTLAGLAGSDGSADGVGSEARFNQPHGVAVDSLGNVYVADTANDTLRQVTPAGVVTTLAGLAGNAGANDGSGSAARFYHPYGVAVNRAGNVYVSDYLNSAIRQVTPAGVVTTLAGLTGTAGSADGTGSAARFNEPAGLAVDSAGNIYVADSGNSTIRLITPAGVVTTLAGQAGDYGDTDGVGTNALFFAPLGVAVDSATNLYVADTYNSTIRKITPVGGVWMVTTIAGSLDQLGRYGFANGAGSGAVFNLPQSIAVDGAGNVFVADTDNNTIRKGVFSQYVPANPVPVSQPANNATLVVTLLPPEASGQWRFPWEQSWRQSGTAASNLAPNQNYTVEFSQEPGYLPVPAEVTVTVTAGQPTVATGTYFPTITTVDEETGGSLQVFFQVNPPSGAGWRLLGDTNTFLSSGFATNLLPGNYLIEFANVANFVQIPIVSVQVSAGLPTVVQEIYQPSQPAPAGVLLPTPVPSSQISDLTDYPYGFNGQLSTDVGFGSGVAVQPNVVLTAAHLIFNDQSLSYVSQAWWYPQEDAPQFVPQPQPARGWLVLSGYASQRTNDLQSGLYTADQSSPQSRNFDVAALYFSSPVAGGGYGGYLPSDASPNSWLTSPAEKMCVGYPVDGSLFEASDVVPGQMCQIGPQPYPLSLATDPVVDQQVYTASWFLGYPGESGGPLYVQFNGYFYPAGVYLGTLFNGTVPYASAVRAIDSNVVALITNAQDFVATGTNNSGGGIITIIPTGVSRSQPAYLIVTLGPPAAVAAGAAWDFIDQPAADFLSGGQSVQELSSSATVQLQFQSTPGWNLPSSQSLSLVAGVNTLAASYTLAVSWSPQTPITYGTPLGSNQLNATTVDPQGNDNYSLPSGSVLDAGSYTLSVTFTPDDTADYGTASATTNVSLVVAPAALTVTAANASRAFGQANPSFTGLIAGLQNGDNITATYTCTATSSSPPGTYSIVPVLADPDNRLGNYQVTLAEGTLTVTAPIVTTPPVIQSATQSGNSFAFTWSATVNQTYQIQSTPNLAQPAWANFGAPLNATNATMTTSQVVSANAQQFYRVVLLP